MLCVGMPSWTLRVGSVFDGETGTQSVMESIPTRERGNEMNLLISVTLVEAVFPVHFPVQAPERTGGSRARAERPSVWVGHPVTSTLLAGCVFEPGTETQSVLDGIPTRERGNESEPLNFGQPPTRAPFPVHFPVLAPERVAAGKCPSPRGPLNSGQPRKDRLSGALSGACTGKAGDGRLWTR